MAGYDRYDDDSYTRSRDRGGRERGYGRERGMFGGGWRGRDEDRERGGRFGGYDRFSDRDQRREREFGRDDHRPGLPIDETGRLIASNKVEGTAVYGRDGHRLGSIYNFMVDKISGRVEYAVMTFGGFLGLGTRYYPLPWRVLTYDTRAGGYRIDMTERDLERAPSFDRDSEPSFDRSYGERVHDYYGLAY
ncbi:MAG TPA: PRC-barrel domain-containing protein [Allosphingosinicella sp.]|nr:PRC-barrel domain-containing protein [Allosphingosinicella sp.]